MIQYVRIVRWGQTGNRWFMIEGAVVSPTGRLVQLVREKLLQRGINWA